MRPLAFWTNFSPKFPWPNLSLRSTRAPLSFRDHFKGTPSLGKPRCFPRTLVSWTMWCLQVWALDSDFVGSNSSSDIYWDSVFFLCKVSSVVKPALRMDASQRGRFPHVPRNHCMVTRSHCCHWALVPSLSLCDGHTGALSLLQFRDLVEGKDDLYIFAFSRMVNEGV